MLRYPAISALTFCFVAATAMAADWVQPPDPVGAIGATMKPDRKIVYKRVGDRELTLDVFDPKGLRSGDERPCLVAIHGGGWKRGNAGWMYPFLTDFVNAGMVGVSLEYRHFSATNTVFDCVKDTRSAIRYVRQHAAELGIDPAKIIVMGASAGGHLALSTMFPTSVEGIDDVADDTSVSCAANVFILHYPVSDTSKGGFGNKVIGARWADLSPLRQVVAGQPPTLIFQGTVDKTVPLRMSQALRDAMIKAGNRCELEIGEGGGHGYVRSDLPTFEATQKRTGEFLQSLGLMDPGARNDATPKPQ